jgi:hypothetical protein
LKFSFFGGAFFEYVHIGPISHPYMESIYITQWRHVKTSKHRPKHGCFRVCYDAHYCCIALRRIKSAVRPCRVDKASSTSRVIALESLLADWKFSFGNKASMYYVFRRLSIRPQQSPVLILFNILLRYFPQYCSEDPTMCPNDSL